MRKLALVLSLVLVVATAYAFVDGDEALREMTLKRLRGDVTVLRDGRPLEVFDESGIEPGDRIRTGSDGRAELRLEGLRGIELAPASGVDVVDETSVAGVGGSLLASARGGDVIDVDFGGVSARSRDGRFRVDLGTGSSSVGVYEGSASIVSPGETAESIERFFEREVAGNDRALSARPLGIDEGDAWDQLLLEDVLLLDERITKLGDGFGTQLGGARLRLDYFRDLVDRPVNFIDRHLKRKPVPELFIGFTIARNAGAPLADAFEESFRYRAQGGRWGLIARIMGAKEDRLVAQLGRTIVDTGVLVADRGSGFQGESRGNDAGSNNSGPGGSRGGASPNEGGAGGDGGSGSGGGGGGGGSGGGGSSAGDPDPAPSPPPEEEEDAGCSLQNPLACLEDPIGGVLGKGGILRP